MLPVPDIWLVVKVPDTGILTVPPQVSTTVPIVIVGFSIVNGPAVAWQPAPNPKIDTVKLYWPSDKSVISRLLFVKLASPTLLHE